MITVMGKKLLAALYLNALRLGHLADDERCGGVGSEDVST